MKTLIGLFAFPIFAITALVTMHRFGILTHIPEVDRVLYSLMSILEII